MPYTFGGNTADDITFGGDTATLAAATLFAIAGWWRPTTLTAGRTLWSAGSVAHCASIGSTTSELEVFTSCTTTPGKWTTSGLGLTANVWTFLAMAITVTNTGPTMGVRVWAGTINTVPVEVSASQSTAPAGTFTGTSVLFAGNKGTGTVAFQGDAALVAYLNSVGLSTNASLLIPAAYGTIDQGEADRFRDLYVIPAWQGDHAKVFDRGRGASATELPSRWLVDLNDGGMAYGRPNSAITPETALTINTATLSQNGCPRPPISRPGWPLRRR